MNHTQEDISKIWIAVKDEKYKDASPHHQPLIISDDDVEQCISIPSEDGSTRLLYSRTPPDGAWEEVGSVRARYS